MRADQEAHSKRIETGPNSSATLRVLKTGVAAALICGSSLIGAPALAADTKATNSSGASAVAEPEDGNGASEKNSGNEALTRPDGKS